MSDVHTEIEALQRQLAEMAARLAELQRTTDAPAPGGEGPRAVETATSAPPRADSAAEEIPEEIVLAISAAVAAFLGERARIRQIRLITSPAWAQQGRVSIQASHRLER